VFRTRRIWTTLPIHKNPVDGLEALFERLRAAAGDVTLEQISFANIKEGWEPVL
jgi:hypothetical protein